MTSKPESVFDELKRFVGFGPADEQRLVAVGLLAEPQLSRIAELFYQRILEFEDARLALMNGESRGGALKLKLQQWMRQLFSGPWDDAYYRGRTLIGQVHVRIGLPQHYMFGAMNLVRAELKAITRQVPEGEREPTQGALDRILDLELAIIFDAYREEQLRKTAQMERLSVFDQLVGSISHELRNPLGVIETSLFMLKARAGADPRTEKHLTRIGDQVTHANQIITQLLEMIRDRPLNRQVIEVRKLIEQAVQTLARPEGVKLQITVGPDLPGLDGDPTQLHQVVVNLLDNAVYAAGPDGEVRVDARAEGQRVVISVEDSGPGVDPKIIDRLFEPLVTDKTRGIGLGLALVRRIVVRHEGMIAHATGELGGARFSITFAKAVQ